MVLDDPVAAEALLRRDYDDLEALGETYLRSTVGGLLAYVLVTLDQPAEAEEIAVAVRDMAGPDDFDAHVLWRRALARRRAEEGRFDEAIALATEAVALTSDAAPVMRAYALSDRAVVLSAAGQADAAAADASAAADLHEAKGNRVGLDAIRRRTAAAAGIPLDASAAPVGGQLHHDHELLVGSVALPEGVEAESLVVVAVARRELAGDVIALVDDADRPGRPPLGGCLGVDHLDR